MSIVDFLKSKGQDSSIQARSKLAGDFGIQNYSGTAEQNINLLSQLKQSSTQVETPKIQPEVKPTIPPAPDLAPDKIDPTKQIKAPEIPQAKITPPAPTGPTPEQQAEFDRQQREGDKIEREKDIKAQEFKPVTSHAEWIQRGKNPAELVDLVESKYGVTAEYDSKTNKVIGYDEAGNKAKEWTFDSAGNSRRKDIPVYTGDQFFQDFNSLLETGDKKTINSFLRKNKNLYTENKDTLKTLVKDFQKQQEIGKTISRLSSLDGKGLYNASLNGDFAQGDDVFNGLSPLKQQEFLAYQKRYIRQDAKNPDKKIVADLKSDDAEEVYNKMAIHNPTYQEKYNEIVFENKERKDLQSGLTTKYEAIEKKRLDLQRLKKKIDKQHPSASETYKRALLNRESGALVDEIEELSLDYNVGLSQFNMINADVQAEYDAYTLDAGIEFDTYQKAIGISVDRYKTDQSQMNQKEILKMQFEQADLTLKKNQEFTMKVKNFDKDRIDKTGNYQTNDKGELLYVIQGVAQKVLDSNGKVVATERFQNYQESLQENKYGGYDIIRTYNDGTRPDISSYDMSGNLVGGTSSVVAGAINKVGANKKLQCGKAVNNYLENLGLNRIFGDSYKSKTDQINSDVPMMGGVAIWNPNRGEGKYKEFGHVGIISGISPDGKTLEITDWNYSGNEEKQVHKVDRSVIEFNGGYHIPKGTRNTTELEKEVILDSKGNKVGTLADAERWAESIYQGERKFSDMPKGFETVVNNSLRTRESKDISEVVSTRELIEKIINHPGMPGLVGSPLGLGNSSFSNLGLGGIFPTVIGSATLPTSDARDFKVLTEQLENKLFLSNIKSMKGMGSLSDAEGKKVAGAAGTLSDYGQSEKSYLDMLNRMLKQTDGIYDKLGGVQMQEKQIEAMKNFTIK